MNEDDICLLCQKLHPPLVMLHASPEDSAEQWARDTALLVQALADMHRVAFGTVSREAVAEMAKGYAELLPPDGSLIARCVARLDSVNYDYEKYGRLSEVAGTDPERLGLLAPAFTGCWRDWRGSLETDIHREAGGGTRPRQPQLDLRLAQERPHQGTADRLPGEGQVADRGGHPRSLRRGVPGGRSVPRRVAAAAACAVTKRLREAVGCGSVRTCRCSPPFPLSPFRVADAERRQHLCVRYAEGAGSEVK